MRSFLLVMAVICAVAAVFSWLIGNIKDLVFFAVGACFWAILSTGERE